MKKALPAAVLEDDSYPPVRGMEAIPHNKLMELIKNQ